MESSDDKLLTAQELRAHLNLKERAFQEKRRARELPPPVRIGGSPRWRWGAVKEWIRAVETIEAMSPGLLRPQTGVAKRRTATAPGREKAHSADTGQKPGSRGKGEA